VSVRLGMCAARTRTMMRVSSKSCSTSSERFSPPSWPSFADGCSRQRSRAISTMVACTFGLPVSTIRSNSSMVSEKMAS